MRPTKLAYLLVPALGATILAIACSDQSPVAPQVVIERPDLDLTAGGSLSGRAVTTVRRFDSRSMMGTIVASDTNTFEAAISPDGPIAARMTAGGRQIDFLLAVGDRGTTTRIGTWTVDGGARNNGPVRTVKLTAVNGAPVSELTFSLGGQIVSRVVTEWARARGGWVAKQRTTMLYQDGALARSITTTFDGPGVGRIAYSRTPIAASLDSRGTLTVPGARFDLGGEGGGDPCRAELDGLQDAVTAYWAADASLITCLAGPWPCLGAVGAVLYTSYQIDVWDGRVDRCLAGL